MRLSRRRLVMLGAGAAVLPLTRDAGTSVEIFRWTGTALGADAEIRIAGLDHDQAARVVSSAVEEVERLEAVFSLYRPASELSRLNRDGLLIGPSHDFRMLLEKSIGYWTATGGAFNPAIQPVWQFLARHFESSVNLPDRRQLAAVLARCGPSHISVSASRISLRPGMALTFNGIAQGYITDRAADLMRAEGLRNVLVNLGELRALPGYDWTIGIEAGHRMTGLADGAIATSSGRGLLFTADGMWHHLIDPRSGMCARYDGDVTIAASTATEADALSTALFVMPPARHSDVMIGFPSARKL